MTDSRKKNENYPRNVDKYKTQKESCPEMLSSQAHEFLIEDEIGTLKMFWAISKLFKQPWKWIFENKIRHSS